MTYRYIFKEGKSLNEPVFVLLHGTGGDEYSLLPLMEMIAPDSAVLSLRGNRIENGMNRFFNRYPDGRIDVADMIEETETLHQFLNDFGKDHGFNERTIIALGYSNGANMIISHFYHSNPVFNGALLFHGMDYRSTDQLPDLKGVSIFAAAGLNDPLVSQQATREMIAKFQASGADVQDYWSTSGHQLTEDEILAAQKWVKSIDDGQNQMKNLLKEINRLARLSRERVLTQKELDMQRELREQYLSIFRGSLKHHLLNMKLIDEKGNDVTPHKVKVIQSNLDKEKDEQLVSKLLNKMKEVEPMNELLGIHHVSMVTSDAKKNVAFYTKVLGMRMVKKTVNQDDVSVYHLFYADQKGSPGTDLTFFEFPGTMATKKGTNSISRVSLRVPSDRSLDFWINRFDELGVTHDEIGTLFGHKVLEFEDFDGTPMRLVSDEKNKGVSGGTPWEKGPIPIEHAIYGLGPVTLTVSRLALIRTFLNNVLHFREVAQEGDLILFEVGEGGHGAQVIVQEDASHSPERPGYGSVHHVAFRVADREALNEWINIMNQTGLPNSGFVDRFYFQSLYVREYNHILFELATDGPGFATDEDEDVLGQRLSLPPFLEGKRAFIEEQLEPLDL
ncbi:glyoxalase [Sporolactobacillus laevolacticus DSM 442]|uniref:UPF0291 protein P343_13800 n=2 Tax=Sporolactobacillus laevolacticus TaxID=33018 RepID=V6J2P0_9BACL|nr:glyoxalase [Sporolactobacillus laevolacticus DSM 442]